MNSKIYLFLALLPTLSLTACRGPQPEVINIKDKRVLTGTWTGKFTQNLYPRSLAMGNNRIYTLGHDRFLRVYDVTTGKEIQQIAMPKAGSVFYRKDGKIILPTPKEVLILDATTLKLENKIDVTIKTVDSHISDDGEHLVYIKNDDEYHTSTRTGKMIKIPRIDYMQRHEMIRSENYKWLVNFSNSTAYRLKDKFEVPIRTFKPNVNKCNPRQHPNTLNSLKNVFIDGEEHLVAYYKQGVIDVIKMNGKIARTVHIYNHIKNEGFTSSAQPSFQTSLSKLASYRYDCSISLTMHDGFKNGILFKGKYTGKVNLKTGKVTLYKGKVNDRSPYYISTTGLIYSKDNSFMFSDFKGRQWEVKPKSNILTFKTQVKFINKGQSDVTGKLKINDKEFDLSGKLNVWDSTTFAEPLAVAPPNKNIHVRLEFKKNKVSGKIEGIGPYRKNIYSLSYVDPVSLEIYTGQITRVP